MKNQIHLEKNYLTKIEKDQTEKTDGVYRKIESDIPVKDFYDKKINKKINMKK